ncbi:MAG: hypothetical protein H6Q59_2353, partial [Firmicutes bacterium]|nr:hypothetical protein [Bacillota bacterium]
MKIFLSMRFSCLSLNFRFRLNKIFIVKIGKAWYDIDNNMWEVCMDTNSNIQLEQQNIKD